MSEEIVQEVEPKSGEGHTPVNLEELEKLKSTNERLLAESKDNKLKYKSVKDELEKLRQQEVERQEDFGAKADFYKTKASEREQEVERLKLAILEKELDSVYQRVAPDCRNPRLVLNNPDYQSDLQAALDVENLSVDEEVLKSLYAKDKEKNDFLYGNKRLPSMVTGEPNSDVKRSTVDTSKMSANELREYYVKMDKLKNRS